MFVPAWLVFLFSGTVMAILVLFWGIKNHQFEDQDRARYLPLAGLSAREIDAPSEPRRGLTYFIILGLIALGPAVLIYTLATVIRVS